METEILSSYLFSVLVATGIGLIIGLEREFRLSTEKDHFAGIRSFPLVSILGHTAATLSHSVSPWFLVAGFLAFIAFVGIAYYVRSSSGHMGITTEVSLSITFVLGAMTANQLYKESLAAAVVSTTLLSLKRPFRSFVASINEDELFAFIKFTVLSLLILPFLPDQSFGPGGIFNPWDIGVAVVIVSSISFVSYVLMKVIGSRKGVLITSFLAGLFSSTAITWLYTNQSRRLNPSSLNLYSAGAILASSVMLVRVAILALIFSTPLFRVLVWPCMVIALAGIAYTFVLGSKSMADEPGETVLSNPLNLASALGFGVLLTVILYLMYMGKQYMGSSGLLLSGLVSGLADVDAVTIAVSRTPDIDMTSAAQAIFVAIASNTVVKLCIVLWRGSPGFRGKVAAGLAAVVVALLTMLLVFFRT